MDINKLVVTLPLLLISCTLSGCGNDNQIVIFTSLEDYRITQLEADLKKNLPNQNVVVQYLDTGTLVSRLQSEGTSSDCDIALGVEATNMEKLISGNSALFADLSSYDSSHYLDELLQYPSYLAGKPVYHIFDKEAGSIILNTKVLADHGLTAPTSFADLLDSKYKGLIEMPNPKTSGTGYYFLNGLVSSWGEEKALAYFDSLSSNIKEFTTSGSGPVKALNRDEIAIGLGMITISAVAFLCTYANQPLSILINTYEKQGSYEMQAVISTIILMTNCFAKFSLMGVAHFINKKTGKREDKFMPLSRFQFDLLTFFERKGPGKFTQRQLADSLTISVGLVNKMMKDFQEDGVIQISEDKTLSLTDKGLKLIEPYKVRKAVIIAAGFGSRMVPVTLETPKPLVKVNGVRIIDTLLDALYAQGIYSIYIVRGYKGNQFDQLLDKYPTIKFIENPLYNESNNISSIYMARDVIDRCYICEADLIIKNPKIITKYQYCTNYLSSFVKETDDWCFTMRGNYIHKVDIGGEDVEQMIGISYWDEADSKKLRSDVEKVFNSRGGKENYWDNVPLKICRKNYKVAVRECARQDVTELDNFSELVMADPSYASFEAKK